MTDKIHKAAFRKRVMSQLGLVRKRPDITATESQYFLVERIDSGKYNYRGAGHPLDYMATRAYLTKGAKYCSKYEGLEGTKGLTAEKVLTQFIDLIDEGRFDSKSREQAAAEKAARLAARGTPPPKALEEVYDSLPLGTTKGAKKDAQPLSVPFLPPRIIDTDPMEEW